MKEIAVNILTQYFYNGSFIPEFNHDFKTY